MVPVYKAVAKHQNIGSAVVAVDVVFMLNS